MGSPIDLGERGRPARENMWLSWRAGRPPSLNNFQELRASLWSSGDFTKLLAGAVAPSALGIVGVCFPWALSICFAKACRLGVSFRKTSACCAAHHGYSLSHLRRCRDFAVVLNVTLKTPPLIGCGYAALSHSCVSHGNSTSVPGYRLSAFT